MAHEAETNGRKMAGSMSLHQLELAHAGIENGLGGIM